MHPRVYQLLMKLVSDYTVFIKQKKGGTSLTMSEVLSQLQILVCERLVQYV